MNKAERQFIVELFERVTALESRVTYLEQFSPLKAAPCLMCGKNSMEVIKERSHGGGFYYIAQCQNCHEMGGPVADSERDAIAAWNRWAGGKSEQ